MQQAALTNRLQAAPDLIYQLIGAVRRVPKGLASASAFSGIVSGCTGLMRGRALPYILNPKP